jgi:hypothetical protein
MQSSTKNERSSEQLYLALLAETQDPRRRRSLENIWRSLEHIRDIGSNDFNIANVCRTIPALGLTGPKEQSVRNIEGKSLRILIEIYAIEYGRKQVKVPTKDEELVASIDDHRTAALVLNILAENRSLKYRLDILKSQFAMMQPLNSMLPTTPENNTNRNFSMLLEQQSQSIARSNLPNNAVVFEAREIFAIQRFLENIEDLDELMKTDPSGAILHPHNGRELAPPGFLDSLRKIASAQLEGV